MTRKNLFPTAKERNQKVATEFEKYPFKYAIIKSREKPTLNADLPVTYYIHHETAPSTIVRVGSYKIHYYNGVKAVGQTIIAANLLITLIRNF